MVIFNSYVKLPEGIHHFGLVTVTSFASTQRIQKATQTRTGSESLQSFTRSEYLPLVKQNKPRVGMRRMMVYWHVLA